MEKERKMQSFKSYPRTVKSFEKVVIDYVPDGLRAKARARKANLLLDIRAWDGNGSITGGMENVLRSTGTIKDDDIRFLMDAQAIPPQVVSFGIWCSLREEKDGSAIPIKVNKVELSDWDQDYDRWYGTVYGKNLKGSFLRLMGGRFLNEDDEMVRNGVLSAGDILDLGFSMSPDLPATSQEK